MKHVHLRDLDVARIGLGAMGMSQGFTGAGSDDAGESVGHAHSPKADAGDVEVAQVHVFHGEILLIVLLWNDFEGR